MIGTSRETVTRLFADFKKKQIVQLRGSTLLIRDKTALDQMNWVKCGLRIYQVFQRGLITD